MQLHQRLFDSYYIVNGLFFISYISYHGYNYINHEYSQSKWDSIIYNFKSNGSVFLTLVALGVVQFLKACSVEQFCRQFFQIAKITIIIRFLIVDITQSILYSVLFMSMYLFLKQPKYLGKPNKMIPIRSEEQFNECVKKFAKKSKKRDESVLTYKHTNMQFVEFYKDNEQLSTDTRALWNQFAERYSTPLFKFYSGNKYEIYLNFKQIQSDKIKEKEQNIFLEQNKLCFIIIIVDVNKVKGIAQEYEINEKQDSNDFPTLILFEEGVLAQRYPCDDANTYLGKQLKKWKKWYQSKQYEYFYELQKAFEKFFMLHNRWYDTKDAKVEDEKEIKEEKKDKQAKKKD